MPLFPYLCLKCQTHSEILVRGSEKPACPECGSTRLEKQMSHFAAMTSAAPAPLPQGCAGGQCPNFQGGGCCSMN